MADLGKLETLEAGRARWRGFWVALHVVLRQDSKSRASAQSLEHRLEFGLCLVSHLEFWA